MRGLPRIGAATAAALFLLSSFPVPEAAADPPPWAPAWGWREKHEHDRGHNHHHPPERDEVRAVAMPFGLSQNICSRELVGAALGGAAGGLIGSNIGKSSGRTAATVGGVIVGLFVGGAIGRSMDRLDQACAGEVLEHVPDRQTVVWQSPQQQGYWVTPVRTYEAGNGRYCREYQSQAIIAGRRQTVTGTACRQPDGTWEIMN